MLKNRYIVTLILLFAVISGVKSQTPYSMYGIGMLDDNTLGVNAGMGGVGYAINNKMQINPKNPASYAAMDSLTFLFDIGMNVETGWFKEGALKETKTTANFDYAVLQFPIGKHLAASLGLLPYSKSNYEYAQSIPFGDHSSNGTGGISQVYLGLAAKLYKELYLGVNASFLFGKITHTSTILPTSDYNVVAMIAQATMHVTDYKLDIGLRYTQPINEKNSLTFGLVYSPKKKLHGKKYNDLYQLETSGEASATLESDTTSLKDSYEMAASYGAGIGYNWNERLIVGLDFMYQPWSKTNFLPLWKKRNSMPSLKGVLNDRYRISVGAEYRNAVYSAKYFDRMRFRIGAYYERSYLKIASNNLSEIGATIGLGLPIIRDKSLINLSAQYFHRKLTPQSLMVENGLVLSIGISFNEFWFFKNKIE